MYYIICYIFSFGRGQWYDEDGGSGPGQGTRSIGRGFRSHDSVVVGANEKNSYSHSKTENGHKEKLSSADDCGWDETPDVEQSESNFSDNTDKFRSNKPYRNNRNGDYRGRGGRFDNNSLNERSGIEQSENRFSDTNRFGSSNRPYRNNENYDYRGRGGRFDSRGNGNSKYHGETRDEGKENWNRDFESGDRGGRGNSRGRRGGGGRGRGGSFGGDDDIPSGGGFRRGGGPSVRGGRIDIL